MGFYLRKSLRAGPLRFNLSKSGLGVSAGIPGFRVGLIGPRGHYVHMGRKGLYYRATLGGGHRTVAGGPSSGQPADGTTLPETPPPAPTEPVLEDVTGATVLGMASSSPSDIVSQLSACESKTRIWPLALVGAIVVGLVALANSSVVGMVITVFSFIAVWWLRNWDIARRAVVIYYDVNDEHSTRYQTLVDGFGAFQSAQRKTQITAEGGTNAYQRKVHAGASKIVSTVPVRAGSGGPDILVTNVQLPTLEAGKRSLYFMPDRVLLRQSSAYTDIPYESLSFDAQQTRWIERGAVPGDSPVIDHTWAYVNNSGGPDRRFKNNRQIPIIRVSELHLSSTNGFNAIYQLSNPEAAGGFVRALHAMQVGPGSKEPTPAPTMSSAAVPRSDRKIVSDEPFADDEQRLITERPAGWEYLLYASVLARRKQGLETKWRQHEIKATSSTDVRVLNDQEALSIIQQAMNEVLGDISLLTKGFDAASQLSAFGPPGRPGDPEKIRELAGNMIAGYEGLLDWAARVRCLKASGRCSELLVLLPALVEKPLVQVREFIDRAARDLNDLPNRVQAAHGQTTTIDLQLTVNVDEVVMAKFNEEVRRINEEMTGTRRGRGRQSRRSR